MDQLVKGPGGEKLTGGDWEWLAQTNRAISLEYAINPRVRDFSKTGGGSKLDSYFRRNSANFASLLTLPETMAEFFRQVRSDTDAGSIEPYWNNGWFPALDVISLCCLLYNNRPARYIEVGSGNSTKFARKLITYFNLPTKIVSIDPMPRAEIDGLCDELIRQPLEDLDPDFLASLSPDDLFFIDSSHRAFQNSDVTVFFLEILPMLPDGLCYGIHDIFLPFDYVEEFVVRFYNEQYLLAAYLHGGAKDEILFSSAFVSVNNHMFPELHPIFDTPALGGVPATGGCFWARRKSNE